MSEKKEYTVTDLYFDISRIYSCKHGDNPAEIEIAIGLLAEAAGRGVNATTFINKIKQLKKANPGDFQSKLVTHIVSRYWEKDFSNILEHRPFKHEKGDFYDE